MTKTTKSAIVFAYHTVGVKCLRSLLKAGFHIPLVLTHADNPNENIWFESVVELCEKEHIPYLLDADLKDTRLQTRLAHISADYLFSFYFRQMIPPAILQLARIAALNMHGSLLPKYRGRVPVNWAVLHGETETGASLHIMETKPDAGDIVSQEVVAIGPDQTAFEVFNAVSDAAVIALEKVMPQLLKGDFPRLKNDLQKGSYFGGRKPEDGLIDWQQSSDQVYNLYRAVAPPYPGAFTSMDNQHYVIAKARKIASGSLPSKTPLGLSIINQEVIGCCADYGGLLIEELYVNGALLGFDALKKTLPSFTNP